MLNRYINLADYIVCKLKTEVSFRLKYKTNTSDTVKTYLFIKTFMKKYVFLFLSVIAYILQPFKSPFTVDGYKH